jgi:adenylylsulfate kinase
MHSAGMVKCALHILLFLNNVERLGNKQDMTDETASSNVVWHHATVTRQRRESQNAHKSVILWFTGLSGAGKSSLAHAVEERLYQQGCRTYVLDGDNVRHGLCGDLGFSVVDRMENIRRIGEVAKLMLESGVITMTAFISPFRAEREAARKLVPHREFLEIYCYADLDICESRDVKGLYKRARAGEISDFTGISSPYEAPLKPELRVDTGTQSIDECVEAVLSLLRRRGVIATS